MLYDVHNVSDLSDHPRTISVRHVKIRPGGVIALPAPLPRELSKDSSLSGLLALSQGADLPAWVIAGRAPKPPARVEVLPPVEEVEVAVIAEPHVDYSELRVAEMSLIFEEVTGHNYKGKKRRDTLIRVLSGLDQAAVLEAIG